MKNRTQTFEKAIAKVSRELENDPEYVGLKEFYEEMKKNGLVVEPKYDLSPIDTIGLCVYENKALL